MKKEKEYTEELPYEKFEKRGSESLTDAELLAIIIRSGSKDASALQIAKEILKLRERENGLASLYHISIKELKEIRGIGDVNAIKIKCIAELSKRISMANARNSLKFQSPRTVADYYMEQMRHLEKEYCYVAFLNTKSGFIHDMCLSIGSINASIVSIREIFKEALRVNAAYVLLLHNHPSGDPTPSAEDIKLTKKVWDASLFLEIPLIDHIIIGDNTYTSFKEKKLL